MVAGASRSGPAAVAKKRFQITQFNPADKNYVYFDIKPTLPKDQGEFSHIRLAVFGTNLFGDALRDALQTMLAGGNWHVVAFVLMREFFALFGAINWIARW